MNYQQVAQEILNNVGGKKNVSGLTHCYTRLRFTLYDTKKANKAHLEKMDEVISVVENSGQYQVVIGNKVAEVHDQIQLLLGDLNKAENKEENKGSIGSRILNTFTSIFIPIIPAIAASGMLKGILALAVMIAAYYWNVDIKEYNTYRILDATSNALFYFFPIMIGYVAAKVFKANELIAMVLAATLCYPDLVDLMTSGSAVTFLGVNVTLADYTSTVIPIIIAVFIMAYVQRFFERITPEVLKIIMVPTFTLLVMVPATLIIFGPIGIHLGSFINWLYYIIMDISPTLLGAFIGGIWCVLVIFGAHKAILPIGINDVAQTGQQNLLAFAGAANFSQAGAAAGVLLKTKNKKLKTLSATATVTALFGITEPAIYGVNLRLKKPMIYAVISGAIGGGLMGWGGSYGTAFANQGFLTIPVYIEAGTKAFLCYIIGIAIAFFGAAAMTMLFGFKDIPEEEDASDEGLGDSEEEAPRTGTDTEVTIPSPVQGKLIPLSEVKDEVFSSGALGEGAAVYPTTGEVAAPADCKVSVLYPTLHAIGLQLENGAELLIHIGFNTVELNGEGFEAHVSAGDEIRKGTKIVSFNIEEIEAKGYDLTTPMVVTNSSQLQGVSIVESNTDRTV
ncbi:beta-glucoside-specific PTS transporter subunit IIABC [Oceanobacillus oncorhynchi]|uniref:beta-glucoside-specific PTS transporter subunit IIABC n=1 Tax=Oceanobacillus oncorhynchi TaxID=545501 RepID=UPI002116A8AA|nr:beta-glucoside-specific PTS transporter subunit IIABC [Oceanobacillus oncorhynchi]UUI40204.1 beta-glucoside-specific PTS transporter subunit IIABC [Oceanobacillus oncorhynchi]